MRKQTIFSPCCKALTKGYGKRNLGGHYVKCLECTKTWIYYLEEGKFDEPNKRPARTYCACFGRKLAPIECKEAA
jgi:hypothetical protein